MSKKLPISVIILTYNEEKNLPQALESIEDYVDEVIVVDSYSDDDTVEIAKDFGARVEQHKFETQAQQFNWALDNIDIKNDWILRLDADEWVTDELWKEIKEILKDVPEDVSGFYMKRRVYFMDKWMKYGGYYPTWFLRLFRKGKGRSEDKEMDEHIILTEGRAKKLKNDFVDENHKGLEFWIDKHNGFSTREVREILKSEKDGARPSGPTGRTRSLKEKVYMKLPRFCRAFAFFTYRYIFRLGFLDGKEGLIFHFLQGCWYRFLVDAKLYEKEKE